MARDEHHVATSVECFGSVAFQCRLQFEQALAQARSSLRVAAIAPQQARQPFARGALVGRQQKVGQQCTCPPTPDDDDRILGRRSPGGGQAKAVEQPHRQGGTLNLTVHCQPLGPDDCEPENLYLLASASGRPAPRPEKPQRRWRSVARTLREDYTSVHSRTPIIARTTDPANDNIAVPGVDRAAERRLVRSPQVLAFCSHSRKPWRTPQVAGRTAEVVSRAFAGRRSVQ